MIFKALNIFFIIDFSKKRILFSGYMEKIKRNEHKINKIDKRSNRQDPLIKAKRNLLLCV